MLNLERLRLLHAIGTYGSVTAAADVLHVTTSAVSQQMAKLEREVGQPLLERNGRGVRLTSAADLLVGHAGRILALVKAAEADLEAHRDLVYGHLSLAAFATAARGLLPQALQTLRTHHPELAVELTEMEPDEALTLISRGTLDVAVVQDWTNAPLTIPDGLHRAPLLDDVVDVALPADHPLAGRHELNLEDLAAEPWISWTHGSVCTDWLLHMLRTKGHEPHIAHTAAEHPTQLALVAAGLGVTVVPRLGRGVLPDGVLTLPVSPTLTRHVYAAWRADAARRPAIRATLSALRDAAEQGLPSAR